MTAQKPPALWPSALLLVLGSLLFIGGGSQHPATDQRMGPLGTAEYLVAFVDSILKTPGWVPMHLMILAGPVCWALAIPGVRQTLPRRADAMWSAATGALVLSATLWVVGFALDTWIAPYYARAIRQMPTPEASATLLTVFGANQNLLARFGLLSLVVGGLATAAVSVGLVATARLVSVRALVGVTGVLLGLWPFVAGLTGEFSPGPFTSHLWRPTALALAAWHIALGLSLFSPDRAATARSVPPSEGRDCAPTGDERDDASPAAAETPAGAIRLGVRPAIVA